MMLVPGPDGTMKMILADNSSVESPPVAAADTGAQQPPGK